MADGNGSPFCGALTGFETFVKVNPPPTGLANLLSIPDPVMFLINMKTVDTTINPSKFQLRLTQIPCDQVNAFGGRNMETTIPKTQVISQAGTAREGRRKNNRVKTPSASSSKIPGKVPTSPSVKPAQELSNLDLLKCLGNSSRTYVPPLPINLPFLGNNVFSDLIAKIFSKVGSPIPIRVAGGNQITDVSTQFPWLGYVLVKNDYDSPFFCGAVLIGSKFALTAAHCVTQKGFSKSKYLVKARFGRTDISNNQNVNLNDLWNDPLSITPNRIVVHAMYDSVTLEYDIAVLELSSAVTLTPVKLPSATGNYDGKAGKVLGWGFTGVDSGYPRNPQSLNVTILSNTACDAVWASQANAYTYTLPRYIQEVMVCSNATESSDAGICIGDSGGPLVVEEDGSHTLVGIISGAFFTCVSSGGAGGKIGTLPDVSSRVSKLLDFINVATS
ncbi:tryptase beta-2-like [Palaemon carinicauda]|uniref:tryptase beta-2-like n=1 Tax=Palaemon carinicauda TaxID=392227 RepID=UPI0035B5BD22